MFVQPEVTKVTTVIIVLGIESSKFLVGLLFGEVSVAYPDIVLYKCSIWLRSGDCAGHQCCSLLYSDGRRRRASEEFVDE